MMGTNVAKTGMTYVSIALFALSGCADSSQESVADQSTPQNGIADSTNNDRVLSGELSAELENDSTAVQRILLDPAHKDVRDTAAFRQAIREAAIKHKISSLTLAPPNEPGTWLEIEGMVVDRDENPIPNAVVNVFGTDEKGFYHPTIEGDGTPRLFGVLVTNSEGKFRFRTIRPGPYPGTQNAEHFHIWASVPGMRMAAPHYSVLDDDPLLQLPENSEQRGEAVRVKMQPPGEDGVAHGTIVLPMR